MPVERMMAMEITKMNGFVKTTLIGAAVAATALVAAAPANAGG